jgi:hypothetical protein
MPWIVTTNIISNLLQVITMGVGVVEAVQLHHDSLKDVKEYINLSREKLALELAIGKMDTRLFRIRNDFSVDRDIKELVEKRQVYAKALHSYSEGNLMRDIVSSEIDKINTKIEELEKEKVKGTSGNTLETQIKEAKTRIQMIEVQLESNPAKELVDANLMQSLVEDINTSSLHDKNKISNWIEDVMNGVPGVIQTAGSTLFLTDKTAWYKVMQETLQLSDLIARDVLNRKLKIVESKKLSGDKDFNEEELKILENYGITKVSARDFTEEEKVVATNVLKANRLHVLQTRFINYTQPNGRYEEYLNKVGLLMFTKYFKRIQREIMAVSSEHPVRSALSLMLVLGGLDTLQSQSMLIKGEGVDGWSPTNWLPVHTPLDVALTAITPPLINIGYETVK